MSIATHLAALMTRTIWIVRDHLVTLHVHDDSALRLNSKYPASLCVLRSEVVEIPSSAGSCSIT